MPDMRDTRRSIRAVLASLALSAGTILAGATGLGAAPVDAPFLAESDAAMGRMMSAMTIKPSGDVDRDFVAMMVPHHQSAIDMAQAELRYGTNETLRRMAQEIIVAQQKEIAEMRLAIGEPAAATPPPGAPAPPGAQPRSASSPHMHQGHK